MQGSEFDGSDGGRKSVDSGVGHTMKETDNTPLHLKFNNPPPDSEIGRESKAPVLEVSTSYVFWKRARIVGAITISAILIATVALTLRHFINSAKIDKAVSRALEIESGGTFSQLETASTMLKKLSDEHSGSQKARAALAWTLIVRAHLYGPEQELISEANEVFSEASGGGPAGEAAAFVLQSSKGDLSDSDVDSDPRLSMAKALRLIEGGDEQAATAVLGSAAAKWPSYVPLSVLGTRFAVKTGNRELLAKMVARLEESGDSHFILSLVRLQQFLPSWRASNITDTRGRAIREAMKPVAEKLKTAPPKSVALGSFLLGRGYLASGQVAKAHANLSQSMSLAPSAETLEWLAFTTQQKEGCKKALSLLQSQKEMRTVGTVEVEAVCYLSQHKLKKAAYLVEELASLGAGADLLTHLRFGLHVRKGELGEALSQLPETLEPAAIGPALELYAQLKQRGRRKDILSLSNTFPESHADCGKMIRKWHNPWGRDSMPDKESLFNDDCMAFLATTWLRSRLLPEEMKRASDAASKGAGASPLMDIRRARAEWVTEGHAKAVATLHRIRQAGPEGAFVKQELARAYLEMGLAKEAMEVLDKVEGPEALALRYDAAVATGDGSADVIAEQAAGMNSEDAHPAVTYVVAKHLFVKGQFEEVVPVVEPALRGAGHWTSELATLASDAVGRLGNRAQGDRILRDAERYISATAGLDEWIDLVVERSEVNLRRGGKFADKAFDTLTRMRKDGLLDAKMLVVLGGIRQQQGKTGGAVELFNEAIQVDPTLKEAYKQLNLAEALEPSHTEMLAKFLPGFTP